MSVNSVSIRFINNRLIVRSGIFMVMLTIFFTTSSFKEHTDHDLRAKQVNLLIRQIGHRLLLQAGDSTSRVLPVTDNKEGTFLLQFENEFVFSHDSLMMMSQTLLPKTEFPSGYTVTVHDCRKGDIVYGFQLNNTTADILACIGRSQPKGCYTIEFTFADLYENADRRKDDIEQSTASGEINSREANSKSEELKVSYLGDDIDQQATSAKIDSKESNSKPGSKAIFAHPVMMIVYGLMLMLGVLLFIRRFGKISKQVPVPQNEEEDIIKEPVPELPALGKFLFDVKGQRLLLDSEIISLTDKECRVLELLHKNFGELIPRDTLMQEVWINEGVITGRSLDMFISKLRKKLSPDPELRITNVHGKGYKLEAMGIQ